MKLSNGWNVDCCVDDDGDLNIYVTNDYTKNINEIDTGQGDGLDGEQLAIRLAAD
jgi:hypothetical protein